MGTLMAQGALAAQHQANHGVKLGPEFRQVRSVERNHAPGGFTFDPLKIAGPLQRRDWRAIPINRHVRVASADFSGKAVDQIGFRKFIDPLDGNVARFPD